MARVIKRFYGQPDDLSQRPRWFEEGEQVDGDLGKVAVREGWATEKKSKGPAPENKSLPASRRGRASKKKTAKK